MMKKYIIAGLFGLLIAAASAMQINGPLVGASLERLAAAPTTPNIGRIYYDTTAGSPKICDGTSCTTIVTPAQMVAALGYTPEDVANKSTAQLLGSSDLLYPSQHAVKVYVDTAFSTTVQTTLGAIDSAAKTASGAAVTGQTLSLQTFDATHPGEVPASGGGTTNYLRADGTWAATPAGFANPMTTWGDLLFENSTPAAARLAGNVSTTKKYLSQTGTGAVSADPVWSQPAFSELSGVATKAQLPATTVYTDQANTYSAGPQSFGTQVATIQLPNTGTTGTTANKLAKMNGSGQLVVTATTDTSGAIGVVVAGAGTAGSADVAQMGQASCVFDNATTAGDFVQISSTTAGDCHDAGASAPATGQVVGRVLSTNVGAGTYPIAVIAGGGGGGGGSGALYIDSLTQSGFNVSLVNDVVSPTASQYYGTNSSSTRGWFNLPTGFANPMTTLGDLMYEDATPTAVRLAGNTTTTKKFLSQTGTGTISAVPSWLQPAFSDLSGICTVAQGCTGLGSLTLHSVLLGEGTSNVAFAVPGAAGIPLVSTGASSDPAFGTATVPGGGTGQTTLTAGALLTGNGTSAVTSIAAGTAKNRLVDTGTAWVSDAPETINFLQNFAAEQTTPLPTAFADGGTTIPVSLTGGTPNTTCTRNTTSPLNGAADFLMTINSGASRQGEGCAWTITIPKAYQVANGLMLSVYFPFATTGTLLSTDVQPWAYDVTNSKVIQPTWVSPIVGASGIAIAQFPIQSNTASIRVANYIARTSTGAATIEYDDVRLAPLGNQVTGVQASDWQAATFSTLAWQGLGTVTNNLQVRRVGDSIQIRGKFTTGTVTASQAQIPIPNNFGSTTSSAAIQANEIGEGHILRNIANTNVFLAPILQPSATYINVSVNLVSSANNPATPANANSTFGNAEVEDLDVTIPMAGLSSQQNIVTAQSFNVSTYLASGTRVTGTAPTSLGQYRSYLRNAGAVTYTETNGTPTATPNVTDGFALYNSTGFSGGDASGQPSKYDIFVGKSKVVKFSCNSSTGKTGFADVTPVISGTNTAGYFTTYDPTTGIFTIVPNLDGTATALKTGSDGTGGGFTASPVYCDIQVSPTALAVANTQQVWDGYQDSISGGCSNSSATFADLSACTGITTHTIASSGISCVQATGSAAGITCTFSQGGYYTVDATAQFDDNAVATGRMSARIVDGVTGNGTVVCPGIGATNQNQSYTIPFVGTYYAAAGTTYSFHIQIANNNGNTILLDQGAGITGESAVVWRIHSAY